MASIQIPEGFIAVAVLIPRNEGEISVKIAGTTADDAEHEFIAEAIKALAEEQVDITDDLIDEQVEPDAPEGEDGEGEEEEEKEEPEHLG
jgi:hypothetical protein